MDASVAEYSTDVLFRSYQALEELMSRLLTYSTLYFEARDVMAFLGGNLTGHFLGDDVKLREVAYPSLYAHAA